MRFLLCLYSSHVQKKKGLGLAMAKLDGLEPRSSVTGRVTRDGWAPAVARGGNTSTSLSSMMQFMSNLSLGIYGLMHDLQFGTSPDCHRSCIRHPLPPTQRLATAEPILTDTPTLSRNLEGVKPGPSNLCSGYYSA